MLDDLRPPDIIRCRGLALGLVLLTGCYEGLAPVAAADGQPDASTGTGDGPGSTPADESTGSMDGVDGPSGATGPATDDDSTGEAPPPDSAIPGLEIDDIHVDQGVRLPLVIDAHSAAPPPALVPGRAARVDASWTLGPDYVPGVVIGRLTLTYADEPQRIYEDVQAIDGPAADEPSGPRFVWTVSEDDIAPDTAFAVSLHPAGGEPPDSVPPRLPEAGLLSLGVDEDETRMRVVLVPLQHITAQCSAVAPTDPATIQAFREHLEMHNPVSEVELTVHAPVPYEGPTEDLLDPLLFVFELRALDDPDPDVFYYGWLDPCDTDTCAGGMGYRLLDPTAAYEAPYRVSVGRSCDWEPRHAYDAAVHELGHNQGRLHVDCSGDEDGVDDAYPHPDGLTHGWGYSIHEDQLYPPTSSDYMSYCEDTWVSDYGWTWSRDVLGALTVLGSSAAAPPPSGSLLTLTMSADGLTRPRVIEGPLPIAAGDETVELLAGDRLVARRPAARHELPDGNATTLTIELPDQGLESITRVVRERDGLRTELMLTEALR